MSRRPLFNRWAWTLALLLPAFPLISCSLFRLAFLVLYREQFEPFSAAEIGMALLAGLRFDAAVVAVVMGIPVFAVFAASPWRRRRGVLLVMTGVVLALWWGMCAVLGADLFYFDFAGRHLSFEVMTLPTDWRPALAMVTGAFLPEALTVFALSLAALGGAAWATLRLSRIGYRPVGGWAHAAQCLGFALVLGIVARGGFQIKPISVGSAFQGADMMLGHLRLNGAFTVKSAWMGKRIRKLAFLPETEAFDRTRRMLGLEGAPHEERYPLVPPTGALPDGGSAPTRRKNLVIIALESFSAQMTGALGGPEGVTPRFDALAREGLLFSRFYANGTRSVEGVAAILSGYPALPGTPAIGSVLEQHRLGNLASALGARGYTSVFIHAAFRGSMWLDRYAVANGFDRFIAQEDFADWRNRSDGAWGVYDEHALERLHAELAGSAKPVFAFLFSLGPHTPYQLPTAYAAPFGPDVPNAAMLNAFAYTDAALGRFFELARGSDYWRDTVFFVTADHNMGKGNLDRRAAMWIPLVILDPGNPKFPAGEIRDTLGSQADLAPTALDALGLNAVTPFAGRSLLAPGGARFALHAWADQVGWQSEGWFVVRDRAHLAGLYRTDGDPELRRNLIQNTKRRQQAAEVLSGLDAYWQTVNNLLLDNRVAPER